MIEPKDTTEQRLYCPVPGIRNHNGTLKPVATLVPEGIWVYCRWSREMEFRSKEECMQYWQEHSPEKD